MLKFHMETKLWNFNLYQESVLVLNIFQENLISKIETFLLRCTGASSSSDSEYRSESVKLYPEFLRCSDPMLCELKQFLPPSDAAAGANCL